MEDFHVLQFGWNFLIVATVTKKYNYFMVRIIQNILINWLQFIKIVFLNICERKVQEKMRNIRKLQTTET